MNHHNVNNTSNGQGIEQEPAQASCKATSTAKPRRASFRNRYPAAMTPDEREDRRWLFVGGRREGVERMEVEGGGVAFLSEKNGKSYAVAFAGKAVKPAFHYSFRTTAQRDEYIAKWSAGLMAKAAARAERSAARKADTHGLMVGSILCATWGWEQINRDWYQVIALVGRATVEVRQISSDVTSDGDHHMSGMAVPVPNSFDGPVMRKRATSDGIRISSYSSASPWDGKPKRVSWYA